MSFAYFNHDLSSSLSIHFVVGISIFIVGIYVNIKSDNILISLREEDKNYKIPKGFLFNNVTCPNYLGEIME